MDSIGVEPGELTFKKVHTNYLKAKRSSSKRWLLILLFSLFAVGSSTAWWFYNSNDQNEQLAHTETTVSNTNEKESENNFENNTSSIKQDSGENVSANNYDANSSNKITPKDQTASEPVNNLNENQNTTSDEKSSSEEGSPKSNVVDQKNESTQNKNTSENRSAGKVQKKNSTNRNTKSVALKSNSSLNTKVQSNKTSANNTSESNSYKHPKTEGHQTTSEIQTNKAVANNGNSDKQTTESKNASELNEQQEQASKKDSVVTFNEGENKENVTEQNSSKIDTVGKDPAKKVNDPKSNDLLTAAPTPTDNLNTDKKNHFYINTELIYYNINYEAKPNGKAPSMYTQNNANFPKLFSDGNPKGSSKIISGAVSLGYTFKNNLSANLGISYFSVENKINGKAFAQNKTQLVLDYYLYDSTMQIIDTVYKVGSSRNINVVNGDTVEAQDYLNNIKYISIPINLSYKLNINPKFGIEPSVGIQYCLPLSSYQLIAIKDNTFTYGKTKNFMNPRATFIDLAMKFNYTLNSNAALYLKPGYYFNNRSIYNVDYALDYRLRNLYCAFGLTLKLK